MTSIRTSRPQRERPAATAVGFQRDLTELLLRLAEFELDAADLCRAASDRSEGPFLRAHLATFVADHVGRVDGLGEHLRARRVDAPTGREAQLLPPDGRIMVEGFLGDRRLLAAMKGHAEGACAVYERTLARDDLSPALRGLFERHLTDSRRHHRWFQQQLVVIPYEGSSDSTSAQGPSPSPA